MSDQTEIGHDKASDTFCEVLKRFGFENVHEIEPRVVSKVPFSHGKHKQVDGYWINANNETAPKKTKLWAIFRRIHISPTGDLDLGDMAFYTHFAPLGLRFLGTSCLFLRVRGL